MTESFIVALVTRKLVPFILLFSLYLISSGHVSPGGGFQGGVVLSTAFILLCLTRGVRETQRLMPVRLAVAFVAISFGLFLLLGLAGIVRHGVFLAKVFPGAVFISILDMIIGVEVGAGATLICYAIMGGETES